jgi:5-methylcytosine-specific restriction endonuclease McrA
MPNRFSDSLRGYGHDTHVKCNFVCQYCGYDDRPFPNWFQLTVEHIIPRSQGGSDEEDNKITVCSACNSMTSRMSFGPDKSREEVLRQKKERVRERQEEFFQFWRDKVAPLYTTGK